MTGISLSRDTSAGGTSCALPRTASGKSLIGRADAGGVRFSDIETAGFRETLPRKNVRRGRAPGGIAQKSAGNVWLATRDLPMSGFHLLRSVLHAIQCPLVLGEGGRAFARITEMDLNALKLQARHVADQEWAALRDAMKDGIPMDLAIFIKGLADHESGSRAILLSIFHAPDAHVAFMVKLAKLALMEAAVQAAD